MIFRRRSDLPLKNDATSRFLPWLVALMVFLSAVALAGVFILNSLIDRWDRDVTGTLTVQVAPATGPAAEARRKTTERVEKAVAVLTGHPGVVSARALDEQQLIDLLAPWLGNSELLRDLPLPQLIDVTLDPNRYVDVSALAEKVQTVPGASLDDHRVWLTRLIALSRTIEWLAAGAVVLIGAVTSATVVYATRTGMAVHHDVIEVLHLMGAPDDYIARQFADRAFVLGLKGGLIGLALAAPTLMGIGLTADRLEGGFLPSLSLPVAGWIVVLSLPAMAALLAMITARATVHGTIARMP